MKSTEKRDWKRGAVELLVGTLGVIGWMLIFLILPQILFGIRM